MEYKVVIGLELHCELNTKSKVFSRAKNEYNVLPNSNIAPLDLALPGTLPVLNLEAVKKALKMSMCLNCEQPDEILFDRKNYYYPDLPKGYQITQTTKPVGINGKVILNIDGKDETILIHDIHLEEDTASLDHFDDYSLLDYNRCGAPLIEIVTEPCINSGKMAVAFLEYLRNTFKYTGVSDADTKKGQIRCDVNISLMKETDTELGTKVEIKNINSFSNVGAAIDYEIKRQTELLNNNRGKDIKQETRRYDDMECKTIKMREKQDSVDYKYFVEPNIPPFKLTKNFLEKIKKEIPELPNERKAKYISEYGLNDYDSSILVKEKNIADYFEDCINLGIESKKSANFIITEILGIINKNLMDIKDIYLTPIQLKKLVDYMDKKIISIKEAKEIIAKVINDNKDVDTYIDLNNTQINDEDKLCEIIDNILTSNNEQVEAYKNGRTNLMAYFVGCVMKETKGKANPKLTTEILQKKLN